jgi:hypothetical protein
LQAAAESFVAGDSTAKETLEGPARQWPFLLEYRQKEWKASAVEED